MTDEWGWCAGHSYFAHVQFLADTCSLLAVFCFLPPSDDKIGVLKPSEVTMALFRIDHSSKAAGVNLPLNLILPNPAAVEEKELSSFNILFLLHGLSDDASAWQRYTNIETLARNQELVVVMPSVGRSFYADMDNGQAYFSYLTDELPDYLRKTFRLEMAREQMLVAGLSMGGYGAFKLAFLRPEMFRAACSLSGALINTQFFIPSHSEDEIKWQHEMDLIFGGLEKFPGSLNDPATWIRMGAADPARLPSLHMACGLQDALLPANRWFHQTARAAGLDVHYVEAEGAHEWLFWGEHLKRWLQVVGDGG